MLLLQKVVVIKQQAVNLFSELMETSFWLGHIWATSFLQFTGTPPGVRLVPAPRSGTKEEFWACLFKNNMIFKFPAGAKPVFYVSLALSAFQVL